MHNGTDVIHMMLIEIDAVAIWLTAILTALTGAFTHLLTNRLR